jgi:hypothetical protein
MFSLSMLGFVILSAIAQCVVYSECYAEYHHAECYGVQCPDAF